MKLVDLVWLCWNKGLVRDIMRERRCIKMNRTICNSKYGSCINPTFQLKVPVIIVYLRMCI